MIWQSTFGSLITERGDHNARMWSNRDSKARTKNIGGSSVSFLESHVYGHKQIRLEFINRESRGDARPSHNDTLGVASCRCREQL